MTYTGPAGGWAGWWVPRPGDSHIAFFHRDGTVMWMPLRVRRASDIPRPPRYKSADGPEKYEYLMKKTDEADAEAKEARVGFKVACRWAFR